MGQPVSRPVTTLVAGKIEASRKRKADQDVAAILKLRTLGILSWLPGLVLTPVACGHGPTSSPSTTSPPKASAPPLISNPLGQPFHVTKAGPDGYDGLVNAFFATEIHATDPRDGTSHVYYTFEIRVSSTKGKLPTSDWSVETANPTSVVHQTHDMSVTDESKTPPLASTASGNVGGYVAFDVPAATPTALDLRDPSSSGALIGQWKLGQR